MRAARWKTRSQPAKARASDGRSRRSPSTNWQATPSRPRRLSAWHEGAHLMAAVDEGANEIGADVSGGAGDRDLHRRTLQNFSARALQTCLARLLRVGPGAADAEVDLERHVQLRRRPPSCRRAACRRRRALSAGASSTSSSCTVSSILTSRASVSITRCTCDHRQLQEVGGGALDRRVARHALAGRAQHAVARLQLGDGAEAAEQRARAAVAIGVLDDVVACTCRATA